MLNFFNSHNDCKLINNAIEKTHLIIEFDLNGIILSANELFLKKFQYSIDELKNQHHKILCDREYVLTHEYEEFWQYLKTGNTKQSIFKRFNKNGNELWLNITYCTIYNAKNDAVKILGICSDVSDFAMDKLESEKMFCELVGIFEQIKNNNYNLLLKESYNHKLNQIKDGINDVLQQLNEKDSVLKSNNILTNEINDILSKTIDDDLSLRIEGEYTNEGQKLKNNFNAFLEKINHSFSFINFIAKDILKNTHVISSDNEELSQKNEKQVVSLSQTNSFVENLFETVKKNAEHAQDARNFATSNNDIAISGSQVSTKAIDALNKISSSSDKIAEIINVIDEIAFQTNLLALNAAVESARAGDAGKGFAVVADEVRNLAQRSAQASKQIKNLIDDSLTQVKNGVELVNSTGDILEQIKNQTTKVSSIINDIANASLNQSNGIEQINAVINQIDSFANQNVNLIKQNIDCTYNLSSDVEKLNNIVSKIKLDEKIFNQVKLKNSHISKSSGYADSSIDVKNNITQKEETGDFKVNSSTINNHSQLLKPKTLMQDELKTNANNVNQNVYLKKNSNNKLENSAKKEDSNFEKTNNIIKNKNDNSLKATDTKVSSFDKAVKNQDISQEILNPKFDDSGKFKTTHHDDWAEF